MNAAGQLAKSGVCYKRVFKRRLYPKCSNHVCLPKNDTGAVFLKCQFDKPCVRCGKTDYDVSGRSTPTARPATRLFAALQGTGPLRGLWRPVDNADPHQLHRLMALLLYTDNVR